MENERNNYLSTYTTQKQINTICVYIYILKNQCVGCMIENDDFLQRKTIGEKNLPTKDQFHINYFPIIKLNFTLCYLVLFEQGWKLMCSFPMFKFSIMQNK